MFNEGSDVLSNSGQLAGIAFLFKQENSVEAKVEHDHIVNCLDHHKKDLFHLFGALAKDIVTGSR